MDELLLLLINYIIIGVLISLATSTLVEIIKPFRDYGKYSLVIAAGISALIITAYNQGILTALGVPQDFSYQPYFRFVDLFITSIVFALGAKAVHQLAQGINYYRDAKNIPTSDFISQTTVTTETNKVEQTNLTNVDEVE